MKLKTVTVPRGYDGLHVEIDGMIINIYPNLDPGNLKPGWTRTNIGISFDNYAGEPRPKFAQVHKDRNGIGILVNVPGVKS